jgi:6,7-dimethyl-8-ribityllumazine synthase
MSAPGPASAQIVVVAALWHRQITDALIAGAERVLGDVGYDWSVIRVPGTFELPLGVQRAFADPSVDGALALGVVIRGGTPHFEYVCRAATDGLLRVSLDARRPVGFGVLTCDTEEQAFDRAGLAHSREDKGAETARAVLAMLSR